MPTAKETIETYAKVYFWEIGIFAAVLFGPGGLDGGPSKDNHAAPDRHAQAATHPSWHTQAGTPKHPFNAARDGHVW